MALTAGGSVSGRAKPGEDEYLCGGGGGVAGARGTTLGDAATDEVGASGAAEVTTPEGVAGGMRSGAGGGAERMPPGIPAPGTTPREDGGGGMREVGAAPPIGLGTTLTGRGGTLTPAPTGKTGEAAAAWSGVAFGALGSFSSPIGDIAGASSAPRQKTVTESAPTRARFRNAWRGAGQKAQSSARPRFRRRLARGLVHH